MFRRSASTGTTAASGPVRAAPRSKEQEQQSSQSAGTGNNGDDGDHGSGAGGSQSTAEEAAAEAEAAARRRREALRQLLRFAAWLPVLAFVLSHGLSVGSVQGGSMAPTFNAETAAAPSPSPSSSNIASSNTSSSSSSPPWRPGMKHARDVVLLNRWSIGTLTYRVGDIVTLRSPEDPSIVLTKRILALEGDVVVLHARAPGRHPSETAASSKDAEGDREQQEEEEESRRWELQPSAAGQAPLSLSDQLARSLLESAGLALSPPTPSSTSTSSGKAFAAHHREYERMRDERVRIRVPPGHAWVEGDASAYAPLPSPSPSASPSSSSASGAAKEARGARGAASRQRSSMGASHDSRDFGPVPLALLTARIDWILWPPRRFGRPAARPGSGSGSGASNNNGAGPLDAGGSSGRSDGQGQEQEQQEDAVSFDPTTGRKQRRRGGSLGGRGGRGRGERDEENGGLSRVQEDSRLSPFYDEASFTMQRTGGRLVQSGAAPAAALPLLDEVAQLRGAGRAGDDGEEQQDPEAEAHARTSRGRARAAAGGGAASAAALKAGFGDLDEAKRRERAEDEGKGEGARERRRRTWLNTLSRGGTLGQDAEDSDAAR